MLHNAIDAQALIDLKILLVIACVLLLSPYIAKLLKLPVSATEIILGALAAFFGFVGKSENFHLLANVGFYFLMFIAGMEVNLRLFFTMQKSLFRRSIFYISLLYLISFIAVSAYGLSLIFVIILPVMSVGLLSILFKDFGKDCEWLNLAMLVATLAEVVSIILLTITGAFLQDTTLFDVGLNLLYLFAFLVFCLFGFKILGILFWWYPNLRLVLMPWQDKNEKDIRFCMAILILVIITMILAHLEIALGAFIAGSFIATFFNHKKDLEEKLAGFGYGFLIPIFFIYIGSTLNLHLLVELGVLEDALYLLLAMIGLRLVCALVFLKKLELKNTILFALSHSMPLTLLIATATLGFNAKVIDFELYSALILTALLEAVFAMSLIKLITNFKKVTNEYKA
ncbi:sodium:proton antiporter [Campylobacter sp. MIT 12-8780]|uniref:cation:proton antiporter n=1 Tax=unclassified Campylobacter TaxID=2593542 RepID=UPI00115C7DE9|nr:MULTISPECIES: cation:proton antiporter [unclassified Campylobacter]NDJ26827.1 cation:proton antiporter [Campylobacter sp. MIT 19-121]TQR42537.1 sodium:proton antiporter [Campylobacter sp. MIT 12-8780]